MKAFNNSFELLNWQPNSRSLILKTLDCHTAGEPLRIVTTGYPEVKGNSILEKRQYCKSHLDHLRKAIIFEPRGHADMYAALVVEPERKDSHFGAIFMHNEGYSNMCGHATIALAKIAVESGLVAKTGDVTEVIIDVPCGQIRAKAFSQEAEVTRVSFECVPSFITHQQVAITLEHFAEIQLDIAFGGAYYAYVDVNQLGINCEPQCYNQLIDYGRKIKQKVLQTFEIKHPFEKQLSELYGTIFIDTSHRKDVHSRNVCVFADGEVDRSPTGSGVSGRAAIHYAKKQLNLNQPIVIESLIGTDFEVEVLREVQFGKYQAIIPQVSGEAYITGINQLIIDPEDPLQSGFILR